MDNTKNNALKLFETLYDVLSEEELSNYSLQLLETDMNDIGVLLFQLNQGIEINECETILDEKFVKTVNAKGGVRRLRDRKTRERLATVTTGMSKSQRRRIARKAAKTKRANPSIGRKAQRLRKRALTKRKALGIRN